MTYFYTVKVCKSFFRHEETSYSSIQVRSFVKGVGGGSEVKFCFQFYLIDSENLEYVGSGTFYRIEKACSVAEM